MSGRALVWALRMPEYDRESGSKRVYDFIEFLREAGWEVSFVANDTCPDERYLRMLQQRGVATYAGTNSHVNELIAAGRFDLAILVFWHVAEECLPTIRRSQGKARIIVDSVDLHFVRNARELLCRTPDNGKSTLLDNNYATEMLRELNVYLAADGVFTVDQKEADLINNLVGDPKLARSVPDCENISPLTIPFEERKGILFVGNFWHRPNVTAAEYLCKEILPRLDPSVLAEHPVYVVGNQLNESIRRLFKQLPDVRIIGWVPSLMPYWQHARISVIPLLYGAGTKRKLVQAMMAGIPTVSTSIGIEGLDLRDGEHVLVADEATTFAHSITRLLRDAELWGHISHHSQAQVVRTHGQEVVRRKFLKAISDVLESEQKPVELADQLKLHSRMLDDQHQQQVALIREKVCAAVPPQATVLVISKGDSELLQLDGRRAEHFPQTETGEYAGYYPADGAAAIAHLEILRAKGADFLVFPKTALWWLDHYSEFKLHLDKSYRTLTSEKDPCQIIDLRSRVLDPGLIERFRPQVLTPARRRWSIRRTRPRILVIGVYLANEKNNIADIVATVAMSRYCDVTQRWVAIGGVAPTKAVGDVTIQVVDEMTPKFVLLNGLLEREDLARFDYVVITDDDVVLPRHFLDHFISLQTDLEFVIAQPARTSNSYIDHPIVEQQLGALARQTLFVEIGPVVSCHKSVYSLIFPFDQANPMGWGYELVWSYLLAQRNLKMGIIDAVPADHSMRPVTAHYTWDEANSGRTAYLERHEHLPLEQCFRVVDVIQSKGID